MRLPYAAATKSFVPQGDEAHSDAAHLFDLFFHSLDLILSGLHLTTKLLDLVVQDKLEFLQLLVLLLQIINTLFLG